MQEKPTYELDEMLKKTDPQSLSSYFKDNTKFLADAKKEFYYFMKDTIESKGKLLKDVYSFAGLNEKYGSKILSMEKHTKKRDVIIRLCVAGHFSLDETNRALKLYGMNPLYSKDKRDTCIIVAIHKKLFDLGSIDEILINQGYEKLSIEE